MPVANHGLGNSGFAGARRCAVDPNPAHIML
jgi:hypothetical protein